MPALDGDGSLRDGAQVVELTDHLDPGVLAAFPAGTRLICRQEHPHPGAQLSLFDQVNGMRHQVFATDTPHGGGSIQFLEVQHRCHARVEDRIRTGKTTGFGRFPSRQFATTKPRVCLNSRKVCSMSKRRRTSASSGRHPPQ